MLKVPKVSDRDLDQSLGISHVTTDYSLPPPYARHTAKPQLKTRTDFVHTTCVYMNSNSIFVQLHSTVPAKPLSSQTVAVVRQDRHDGERVTEYPQCFRVRVSHQREGSPEDAIICCTRNRPARE
jgi:hypothetical protein